MDEFLLSGRLGANLVQLRESRGLTQEQIAKLAGVPRATWANLESGAANPTLAVLYRVAQALQVPLEELIATPRAAVAHYKAGTLPERERGHGVRVRKLLPDPIPGMEIDRLELKPQSRMTGIPHTPGTREYLMCEEGKIELTAAGETFLLAAGDVVAFRGDQKHAYANHERVRAIGYSVVVIAKAP
jgi:transcriptional regulator with XRE-family HTH domain